MSWDKSQFRGLDLRPKKKLIKHKEFWRRADPIMDPDKARSVIKGGMWPDQRKWWELPDFFRVMVGGYGCISGDTKIFDPVTNTETAVEELHRAGQPLHVLALLPDGTHIVAKASAPFIKGVAALYKVTLSDGKSITVTKAHRFFTPHGWKHLSDVCVGHLLGCAGVQHQTISGSAPSTPPANARHCFQTPEDSQSSYSEDFYLCDGQLREVSVVVPDDLPSQAGALARNQRCWHTDDKAGEAECSHVYQSSFLPYRNCSLSLFEPLYLSEGFPEVSFAHAQLPHYNQEFFQSPKSSSWKQHNHANTIHPLESGEDRQRAIQRGYESLLDQQLEFYEACIHKHGASPVSDEVSNHHGTADKVSQGSLVSFTNHNSWLRVVNIEYVGKNVFYDLTVPGPENYLAQGIWNHNSGKTNIGGKWALSMALTNSGIPFGCVSPSFPLARKTIVPTIIELLHGKQSIYGSQFWWKHRRTPGNVEFEIKFHGRTGIIYIMSGEDPLSLRGPNLCGALIDEPFIQDVEVFQQMVARIRHPDAKIMAMGLTGCVTRNTWVVTKEGLKQIGDLDPGTKTKQFKPINIDVLGVHNEFNKATQYFNNGLDDTVIAKLTNGYELEATPDHPVLTMGADGVPVFKRLGSRKGKYAHLEQLQLGDFVAVSRGNNIWGNIEPLVGFAEYLEEERKTRHKENYVNPFPNKSDYKMTKGFAYFLGLWVAEGSLCANRVEISCGDACVTNSLKTKGVLGIKFKRLHDLSHGVTSKDLHTLMKFLKMPLVKAPYKFIPKWVFAGKRKWALAFLAGMFDGDGHVCKDGTAIGYSTTSKQLAVELQQILLNLGIVSHRDSVWNKPTSKAKVWSLVNHVRITGNSAGRLAKMLPLRIKRKLEQLEIYKVGRDSDKIPNQKELVLQAWSERLKQRWRCITNSNLQPTKIIETIKKHDGRIAYSTAQDFINCWRQNEPKPNDTIEQLQSNVSDGYYWAKVEQLTLGQAETVDFVVPQTHSFVGNGAINRNTPEQINWGHDLCFGDMNDEYKKMGYNVGVVQASTRGNLAVGTEYVQRLESTFSGKAAAAYVDGEFVNLSKGIVMYGFDRARNIKHIPYLFKDGQCYVDLEQGAGAEPVTWIVGMDFNVNPMAFIVGWHTKTHVHWQEEFELDNSDTEYACSVLRDDFRTGGKKGVNYWNLGLRNIYPDPTGNRRQTASPGGRTDFHYIKAAGFTVRARSAHPNIRDLENAVNGKLNPRNGPLGMTIEPTCKKLIHYYSNHTHEMKNKQEEMTHLIRASQYPVEMLFPIVRDTPVVQVLYGA